jgi:hypothetical protein
MLAKRLTDALGDELNDLEPGYEHIRWPLAFLYEYINEALEQIGSLKPELFAVSENFQLTPGAVQVVPNTLSMLMDIPFNINIDGSLGSAVVPANYTLLRYFSKPACASSGDGVSSFRVDPKNPRVFYVNPPATTYPPQYVQLLGQAKAQIVVSASDEIEFPGGDSGLYFNSIKDWALYRAFMRDTESQTSLQRADKHYRAFYQFLNVKVQMESFNKAQRKQGRTAGDTNDAGV